MNRQSRRHPTHPLLPILYPSKKRIPDNNKNAAKVSSVAKRVCSYKRKFLDI